MLSNNLLTGRIIKAISSFYYVYADGTVYECKARGNFKNKGKSILVGDFVEISLTDETHGVVESVNERKNELTRPIIANIDKLFIVSSYTKPTPDFLMIDRLIALSIYHNIEPVIIFNKADIGDFSDYISVYKNAGFKTFAVSALLGEGIDELKPLLKNCITAFAGNSGVGKSTIINAIFGDELKLQTGEVSNKLGRGRHTTRHTELFIHKYGGFVADTPGFSSLEKEKPDYAFKEHLSDFFPDFDNFKDNCKFTSCTHTCEKGCGVLTAVNEGKIEITRHNSYITLFNELKDLKEWEIKK